MFCVVGLLCSTYTEFLHPENAAKVNIKAGFIWLDINLVLHARDGKTTDAELCTVQIASSVRMSVASRGWTSLALPSRFASLPMDQLLFSLPLCVMELRPVIY
jgi:hypothetical protein